MSVADKLTTIANNVERVFLAGENRGEKRGLETGYAVGYGEGKEVGIAEGKQAEYDKFWDEYQQDGKRTAYVNGFTVGFSDENFFPKYDIVAKSANSMFSSTRITDLKQRLIDCGVSLDTSGAPQLYTSFNNTTLTHIPEVGGTNVTNIQNCFNSSLILQSVDKLILSPTANCSCTLAFNQLRSLVEIRFGENISPVDLNLQWSPLSHDSLMSLINALADKTGVSGTWSIVLGPNNIAKLTQEELDIMEGKGWDYS